MNPDTSDAKTHSVSPCYVSLVNTETVHDRCLTTVYRRKKGKKEGKMERRKKRRKV